MNKFHFLSLLSLVVGIVFFYLGFINGEVEAGIFFIFPFISGSGIYSFLGLVFIIISIFLFLFGFTNFSLKEDFQQENYEPKSSRKTSIKGGGVVLVGPIPIVFASNWKIAAVLMIIAIIVIVLAFFLL